ncbi:MAG TPA: hypothetical protein DDX72_03065 [Ruminococcaceae bacterium]|nr:hypothetical protein [Oscillospiraceae bacterium]
MWYDSRFKTYKDIREGRTDRITVFMEIIKPALIIMAILLLIAVGAAVTINIIENASLIHGEEGMLDYARSMHGEGLEFRGSVSDGGETIAFFSFDPSNPTCMPIVFTNKGNDNYKVSDDFNRSLSADACNCIWHHGFAIHVENPEITAITIVSRESTTIPVTEYPFNTYWAFDGGSSTHIFYLDKDGNIITQD